MAVYFFFNDVTIRLKHRKKLKTFIQQIFKLERSALFSVNYIFCTDEYLLSINLEFLKHDYYTDIITFLLSKPPLPINGEIYISTDRVKNNARSLNISTNQELHRVIFHGALHLCGYKDKTPRQKQIMVSKEDEYLEMYFK